VRELLAREPALWYSVSATDRAPRPGEVDGRDYRFVSRDEFERLRDHDGFLEWFEVYGDLKGTPRAPVDEHLAAGDDVLLECDVQGALAVRAALPDAFVVFIRAPSRAVQRERLHHRDPDAAPDVLERRLDEADAEEQRAPRFDAVVVNDDLTHAVDEVVDLLHRQRQHR
jgi:guanylate kinase